MGAPTQTQPTLLCAQIVLAFREPSLAPLATRLAPWITRHLDAPAGRREALMARGAPMKEQLSQGTPIPNRSTKELVELTLRQELILMPLPLLILKLQRSLGMLSKSTNRNKAVCK